MTSEGASVEGFCGRGWKQCKEHKRALSQRNQQVGAITAQSTRTFFFLYVASRVLPKRDEDIGNHWKDVLMASNSDQI